MLLNSKSLFLMNSCGANQQNQPPADFEGFMSMIGHGEKKAERYYFVLRHNVLYYFSDRRSKETAEPVGLLVLENHRVEFSPHNDEQLIVVFPEEKLSKKTRGNGSVGGSSAGKRITLCAHDESDPDYVLKWARKLTNAGFAFAMNQRDRLQEIMNITLQGTDHDDVFTDLDSSPARMSSRRINPFGPPEAGVGKSKFYVETGTAVSDRLNKINLDDLPSWTRLIVDDIPFEIIHEEYGEKLFEVMAEAKASNDELRRRSSVRTLTDAENKLVGLSKAVQSDDLISF